MSEIKSKIHNYGNINESEWPPRFGTGGGGRYHVKNGELKEGNPETTIKRYGTAPVAIFDSMPAQYHEKAGRVIESRKDWDRADKETGSITFGSREEVQRTTTKGILEEQKALKKDRRKASLASTQAYKENPAEVKQRLEKQGEEQIKTLKKSGLTKQLKEAGIRYE